MSKRVRFAASALIFMLLIGTACQDDPPSTPDSSLWVSIRDLSEDCRHPGDSVVLAADVGGGTPPYTFAWTLGPGGPAPFSNGKDPGQYTFPEPARYSFALEVEDSGGGRTWDRRSFLVKNDCSPPVATILSPADGATVPAGTVRFDAEASGGDRHPHGTPYHYKWHLNGELIIIVIGSSHYEFDLPPGPHTVGVQAVDALETGPLVTVTVLSSATRAGGKR